MKKILALICCLAVVLSLVSCRDVVEYLLSRRDIDTIDINGIENFSYGTSALEVGWIVPSSCIDKYEYVSGDYFYHEYHRGWASLFEKFIIYFRYDNEVYELAKAAALDVNTIDITTAIPELKIGAYDFYLSGWESSFEKSYPGETIYMYVILNEKEQMLLFMCIRSSPGSNKDVCEAIDNLYATEGLKGIIDEYFIEWYDFYETNNA